MNLDGRIIDKKKIFDSFEIEEAEKYLGKEGYFANSNEMFSNLDNCIFGKLEEINDDIKPYSDSYLNYRYFLPEKFVKEKQAKKKYRPCTLDEFGLNIGDLIRFRKKDDHNFEICTMYMGYIKTNGIVKVVLLGQCYYSLEVLFNDYEWYDRDSNTWEMFGVENDTENN